jgi:O-antigen ligase
MLSRFIFFSLCIVIIYTPIPLGANRIWASSSIEFYVFFIFTFHLLLSIQQTHKLLPPKYSLPVLIPLFITVLWLVIQMLPWLGSTANRVTHTLSFDPSLTHIMLLKSLAFFMFTWLVFCYVNNKKRIYLFALVMLISGLFQAIYGAWLNLNEGMVSPIFNVPYSQRATGSFMYQNQLANYLSLTLAIGIGLLISQLALIKSSLTFRQKTRDIALTILSAKMVIRISLIIMIICLILTRSRMGNSAFFIALLLTSLFSFFFYNQKPKNLRLLIISFFILDLFLIGTIFGVEKVKKRLLETSLQSETRDEVVRDSLQIIFDYPIFGTGGGSFYSSFPSYHPEFYSGFYDHAHNDYIQFAVELGLPVTILLGSMMLFCLFISLKTIVKRKTPLYQGISFGCSMAIFHMILHSTVDFSLQSPAIAILFISILALGLIISEVKRT